MRYLIRSVSGRVDGVGHVRAGVITSVPDHLADALLATGEWRDAQEPAKAPERVTEVPPPLPSRAPTKSKTRKGR